MSAHATTARLSAYLDRELPAPEARRVEEHLADCPHCRSELESLTRVVGHLRRLERSAPPPVLAGRVARHVAIERERRGHGSLVQRLERRLARFELDSPVFTTFAVVLALASILYLFSASLQVIEHRRIPVRVAAPGPPVLGPRAEAAGLTFELRRDVWWQLGLSEAIEVDETYLTNGPGGRWLLERHPDLGTLLGRGQVVVLRDDGGRVVAIMSVGSSSS